MRILIAPLNWGLGHATRCVPLVRRYIEQGHEVVLGGDGESLIWLQHYFPDLRTIELASLNLRYSKGKSQVGAMLKALPQLIHFSLEDEARLNQLLLVEPFDVVVSDNRFGLRNEHVKSVYVTHQLWIRLPKGWKWLEPFVAKLHARVYNRFDEVWVPDYADRESNLSGLLGHPKTISDKVKYIGPLSRFSDGPIATSSTYHTVALLSGLEPQRTLLEEQVVLRLLEEGVPALVVQGKVREPFTRVTHANLTKVPYLSDELLTEALMGAQKIICRSGYSTIMDLAQLGLLDRVEWVPTPGQPEQEYLAERLKNNTFLTQKRK